MRRNVDQLQGPDQSDRLNSGGGSVSRETWICFLLLIKPSFPLYKCYPRPQTPRKALAVLLYPHVREVPGLNLL